MKMNLDETLGCLTALFDLLTHCDENTSVKSIQEASFLGLCLLNNLKHKENNNILN
ncbi:hypothetical protein [Yersinia enterocolitica]|uniref:hypothetical protein n=1 Tax=Yersinia enterocolitica TaxID=630 RepID=UPI003D018F01